MDKVSVIIPTYNRFKYLINAIEHIKNQTYKNLEIIVINDCSTQEEYYNFDWDKFDVVIIHLSENSKKKFGFPCVGYVRNIGIKKSTGKYIAFCDDDDIWFPKKTELQIDAIKNSNCRISATDGLIGSGIYDLNKKYKKYNEEYYFPILFNIYENFIKNKSSKEKNYNPLKNGFPRIWTLDFLKIHNCIINSSVIVEKDLLIEQGMIPHIQRGQDYACWLKILEKTNCLYLKDICFYYDLNHGAGSNH